MPEATLDRLNFPQDGEIQTHRDMLTEILRAGALDLLGHAVRAEVAQWIDERAHLTDEYGHRQVVRNGYAAPTDDSSRGWGRWKSPCPGSTTDAPKANANGSPARSSHRICARPRRSTS